MIAARPLCGSFLIVAGAVLAVLNAMFIVAGVFAEAEELSTWAVLQTGLFTGGLVAAVYGLYFIVTYAGSKRILKLEKGSLAGG